MRLRPALLLAAPAGVLGGHAIGYLAAPGPAGSEALHHGYLALVLAVALPLAVLGAAWAATEGAVGPAGGGGIGVRSVPVAPLLVAQWVLFTGQEVAEHTLSGHGPAAALQSQALWWGLAAQVVTALAILLLVRASAAAGARLLALAGRSLPVVLALVSWRPPGGTRPATSSPVAANSARGPPPARFA